MRVAGPFAALLAVLLPALAWGTPIVQQELVVDAPVAAYGLGGLLLTRVGGEDRQELVDRSVRRLLATGLFREVVAERQAVPGGVRLVYRAVRHRRVGEIRFRGNLRFLDRTLGATLPFRSGADWRDGLGEEGREALRQFYRGRGYLRAEVASAPLEETPEGEVHVTFVLREGPRVVVEALEFEGLHGLAVSDLQPVVRTEVGEFFHGPTFRGDLERVEERYLDAGFFGVEVRGEEVLEAETVRLWIRVREGRRTPVRFEGNRAFPDRLLARRLTFREERVVDEFEIEASAKALTAWYREHGYAHARVTALAETVDGERGVGIRIEEGPRVTVEAVDLTGTTLSVRRLRSRLRTRPGQPFTASLLDQDRDGLLAAHQGEGFLDARVTPVTEFPSPDRVRVRFVVEEGVRTLVEAIGLEGNRVLPDARILERLRLTPGQPFRREEWEADRFAILDLYGAEGHIYAEVQSDLEFSPDRRRVGVVFRITEKHQARVGDVAVVGNVRTRPHVLLREFPLAPGEPYRYTEALRGQQRIFELGYIRSARLIPLEPEAEPEEVALLLRVEEREAGLLSFGLGYSSEERARGFIEVGHRNLWGTGRRVTLRLKGSEIGYRGDLTYLEPWVFGRRVDGDANLFTEFREERGFDIRRNGVSLGLRRDLTERVKGRLGYTLEDVELSRIADPVATLEDVGAHTTSSIALSLSYEGRDDVLEPRRGFFVGSTLTYAGGPLLGQDDFAKAEAEVGGFLPLGPTVLALGARGGVAFPYARSERVPIHERFFAGGGSSVRGFEEKRLGPKDPGGTPRGGEAVLTTSVELRFPIWRALGGVGFLDGGQVWRSVEEIELDGPGDLQWAVGAGLRLRTPVGPVRLDYGYRLQEERGQDRWRVHFTLGHAF